MVVTGSKSGEWEFEFEFYVIALCRIGRRRTLGVGFICFKEFELLAWNLPHRSTPSGRIGKNFNRNVVARKQTQVTCVSPCADAPFIHIKTSFHSHRTSPPTPSALATAIDAQRGAIHPSYCMLMGKSSGDDQIAVLRERRKICSNVYKFANNTGACTSESAISDLQLTKHICATR